MSDKNLFSAMIVCMLISIHAIFVASRKDLADLLKNIIRERESEHVNASGKKVSNCV